jgi:hypothetical protein
MKTQNWVTVAIGAAALTAAATTAGAANLVQNGGFESTTNTQSTLMSGTNTSVTDWDSEGTFVILAFPNQIDDEGILGGFALAGPANGSANGITGSPDGGNFMAFDSDPAFHGTFSQTINGLVAGQTYALSFYAGGGEEVGGNTPTTTAFTVSLGSDSFTTPTISTPAAGFSPWQLETTSFVASSSSELLSFLATGGPGGEPPYALLDGVTLTGATAAVPEPAAWAMMLAAVGGIGFMARRRRRAATTA